MSKLEEAMKRLTSDLDKLERLVESNSLVGHNVSDNHDSCLHLTWVTYFLDGKEYVSKGLLHVPRVGDKVDLFGTHYVVETVLWLHERSEQRVEIVVEPTKRNSRAPLGIRNNNPGNIRNNGVQWEGLAETQTGPFYQFKSPKWGIRAMARILKTYANKHAINNIHGVISRWAPPTKRMPDGTTVFENDTNAYILFVSKRANVPPMEAIDLSNKDVLIGLISAIIFYENGSQPYLIEQIAEGVSLA